MSRIKLNVALAIVLAALVLESYAADTGTLTLRVEARSVSPVAGDPEELHWVLLGTPTFSLASERGKADINRRLAAAKEALSAAGCRVQIVQARSVCNLLARMESDTLFIQLGALETPPAAPEAAREFTLTFDYTETPAATIEKLNVEVWTESAENAGTPDSATLTYTQAMERLGRPAVAELAAVTIAVHYTPADATRGPRGEPFPASRIEDALFDVARLALEPVRVQGVIPQKPAPDDETVLGKLDDEIRMQFSTGIHNWPQPRANVQYADETRAEVHVQIRGVQIVAFARIDVERGQIEDEEGQLVNFRGADERIEREIREDIQQAQDALNESLRNQLEALEGRVPPPAEVAAIRDALAKRREIRGFPRIEGHPGGNVVYKGTRAWVIGKVDAKLKAAFTPEDLLTGGGTVTAERLLYNLFKYDFGETYSYALRTGTTLQDTEFVLGFPRTRGQAWIANYGGDVTALYSRDTKQMFGATYRDLTEREKGVQPRAYFEITKAPGAKWPLVSRVDALFDRRNLLLRPSAGGADLTNGQLAALTLRLRQGFGYVAKPEDENASAGGLGNITFDFNGEGRKGIESLGGHFDFRQYLVSGRIETFFGFQTRRDFLLRYRRGFGASSNQTPAYQAFRLGGSGSLRGIEEGEFVGPGIGFAQVDAGVSVRFLWRLLHPPKPPDPNAAPAEAVPPPPISLDQIYIAVFYDRAAVMSSNRVGDLLSLENAYWGRGIAAEIRGMGAGLRRTNLSIGYARSPQSILHRKGVMTIGVSFDLY